MENPGKFVRQYLFILLIVLAFLVVYAASLTFVYVTGDDAATILWHAQGRNHQIWSPYAHYEGMWDTWLSFLPAHEPTLRFSAMSISAMGGLFFTILSMALIFEWLDIQSWQQRVFLSLSALLIFPELFFLGLVIDTALIGMPFILVSHLIARRSILTRSSILRKKQEWINLLISVILFGLGVSLRWYLIVYGLVIVTDTILSKSNLRSLKFEELRHRTLLSFIWGGLAILSSLLFITLSGQWIYLISTFTGVVNWLSHDIGYSIYLLAGLNTFFSPAAIVLAILGIWIMIRKRSDLLFIVLFSFLSIIPVIKTDEVKQILTFVPAFMLCSILGITSIMSFSHKKMQKAFGGFVIILLLLPWFIGLTVYSPNTRWGPGFEMRRIGESINTTNRSTLNVSAWGRIFPVENITLRLGDGLAVSTGEGPRPLGAYGAVLLGGGWRDFVSTRDREFQEAILLSIQEKTPFLLCGMTPIFWPD